MSSKTKSNSDKNEAKVERHSTVSRIIHWSIAVSTLVLIISGMGQMPLYERYMVTEIPGLGWMGSYEILLMMHYIGAAVLMVAAFFHVVYHLLRKETGLLPRKGDFKESYLIIKAMMGKGEEPPQDKYLAEQRLAYAFIAFSFLLIIVSGLIKTAGNLPGLQLSSTMMVWMTQIHNLAMVLIIIGIVMHLVAFIIKENRPLLESMFTGKVCEEYARHRHPKWYCRIIPQRKINQVSDDSSD